MAANQQAKRKAILAALGAGNTRRAACAFARLDHATFYRWMQADATFCDEVEKAEADAEMECVEVIKSAATSGIWTAAAWLLERKPQTKQDWKKVDELDLRKLTVEQLLALEGEIARRTDSAGDRAAREAGERERLER